MDGSATGDPILDVLHAAEQAGSTTVLPLFAWSGETVTWPDQVGLVDVRDAVSEYLRVLLGEHGDADTDAVAARLAQFTLGGGARSWQAR